MLTKNISKIILFILLISTFSCSDQLDIFPQDSIATEDLTSGDLESLLNGVYASFRNTYADNGNSSLITDFDLLAGNFKTGPLFGASTFETHNIPTTDGYVEYVWSTIYASIFDANILLEVIGDETGFEETESSALYLRSLGYYWLVTRFGGVPLIESSSETSNRRATEEETWNLIIRDLNAALAKAPDFSGPNFVSKEAIMALLARVYLYVGDNAQALQMSQNVIDAGHFSLESDFSDIFSSNTSDELIFGFSNVEEFSRLTRIFTTNDHPNNGSQVYIPTDFALNDLFDPTDTRSEVSAISFNNQPMVNKWANDPTASLIVSRLGEIYLINAEAQGFPGGIARLNQLRAIRGLAAVTPADQAEFIDLIIEERRKELYAEGFHFYDLVRTGKAIQEIPTITSENQYLLPIPQREIDIEGYTQNPGY
ncbi:RagB/SusD family nutrient uptake outer membrane protein [Fulvivirgaceae bacterium BMA10]|uniref:RagB/SusD family nutrient uptake outer membrane protein n=1 Tax=Splendidivirga corallicola TaxID=3051826 RepID=A0ABT8KLU0_9BACT|nr:RagB/SusD family nutrient uptake outer membrane protein [Fulvivirgaceae bacterium BMA10]